jgi:small-conductance mechanosensitive channel
MKLHLRLALISAGLAVRLAAAEDPSPIAEPAAPPPPHASTLSAAEQQKLESAIRERLAEHTLEKASKNAPAVHTAPATPAANVPGTKAATSAANPEVTTLMPRVEVNKSRITELAIKEHEKDLEIAREKQLTKPTALDAGLNDSEISQKLAILGGSSAEQRARVAQERVSLLEAEKDLLDEIARAPTKAERDELQKQLNELKTMRRELERAPRDERK